MTRRFIAFILAFACGCLPAFAQSVSLDLVNEYPATSIPGEADRFFAEQVAARLGGRVAVRPVAAAQSGLRSREQIDAVASGRVAMANTFGGAIGELDPVFAIASLPFLTPTVASAQRLYELAEARYVQAFASRNQKLLFVTPWPPSGLWTTRPVDSLAALRSLRLRTYDATGTTLFRRLAASAEIVSFADLEPRLAAGTIDAVLSSGDGGAGRRLWTRLPHFAAISYAIPLSFGTINLDVWNRLDAETRASLEAIGRETSARQWLAMTGRVEQNYATMRANGMTIATTVPPDVLAALQEAAIPAIDAWAAKAGEDDRAVLSRFRAEPPR
ncbi:MAG: TRAP transporter substrate-binding protein [Phreatobacter sp.]|uniref:TRAP transporter substrate-binding protein n=1 Tax=Phreatobacter sp. TaxID=1966341 RepID=UPI001A467623|nr:TRAP transporter substrate-binding protein [Phreatobacter sp.]MBL8568083.1 TRAP transporter substrate-binding protein [Phreatobacter sp.]